MDEADYMLDLGFLKDMEKILGAIRQSGNGRAHQTLLFSATLPDWVAQTSKTFMTKDKVTIDLVGEADSKVANTITHYAMPSPLAERNDTIRDAIEQFGKESSTLVFVERRTDAAGVVTALGQTMRVAALHGDVSQAGRDAILNNFKSGSLQCVVATDVAARGLDIPSVGLVIQAGLSQDRENFVHRAGRTGRAGKLGTNIVIFESRFQSELSLLQQHYNFKFQPLVLQPNNLRLHLIGGELQNLISKEPVASVQKAVASLNPSQMEKALCVAIAKLCKVSDARKSYLTGETGLATYILHHTRPIRSFFEAKQILTFALRSGDVLPRNLSLLQDAQGIAFDMRHDFVPPQNEMLRLAEGVPTVKPLLPDSKRSFSRNRNDKGPPQRSFRQSRSPRDEYQDKRTFPPYEQRFRSSRHG